VTVDEPRIEPFGDAAILITLGERTDPELTAQARAVSRAIEELRATNPALGRAVPAHASVLVPVDPLRDDPIAAAARLRPTVEDALAGYGAGEDRPGDRPPIEIPVRYGGEDGPDLHEVAAAIGGTAADVVELHATATYRVLFLGFAPGFAYLGPVPPPLAIPRRASPREQIPPGSVAIAGGQTAVYPRRMPGGWHLIGRTDAILWAIDRPNPSLLAPGDRVRFVPLNPA
jgi:KipI family sensor histidine kinase inhibitor